MSSDLQPLKSLKKKDVEYWLRQRILPAISDPGWQIYDKEFAVKVQDELLVDFGLKRSRFGKSVTLGFCAYPLYAPLDFPGWPGTFGAGGNQIVPGTPVGYVMETDHGVESSLEQIIIICRDHIVPFLSRIKSSRELLGMAEAGKDKPVFGADPEVWHYWFLLGFVAAYCGEYVKVGPFFQKAHWSIRNCHAQHDDVRRLEMAELERLLDDEQAVRRHLASNAYYARKLLKLPFAFNATAYGLPRDWTPPSAST